MKLSVPWSTILLLVPLSTAFGIQVREPDEGDVESLALTANEPTDNGMTVGESPIEATTRSLSTPLFEVPPDIELPTVKPIVDAIFPENHKNFTSGVFAGTLEAPPLLNSLNKYQNAYKEYYNQKKEYINAKPVKFEENHTKNRYVTNGLTAYGDETPAQSNVQLRNRPFPYIYEANLDHFDSSVTEEDNSIGVSSNEEQGNEETTTESDVSLISSFGKSPFAGWFGSSKSPSYKHPQPEHKSEIKKKSSSWVKFVRLLSTALPFGLFLATLTPNILQITNIEDNRPSRLRSLDGSKISGENMNDPLVVLVQKFGGLEAMDDPICEDRFFCEMSVLGKNETSNFLERGFWFLANETPEEMAQAAGMKDLFKAIKSNNCDIYACEYSQKRDAEMNLQETTTEQLQRIGKEVKSKKVKKFFRN